MAVFKDRLNREWVLALDVATIERLESRVPGFQLDGLLTGDASGLYALFEAPVKFVRLLWLLVEAQAARTGAEPEAFGAAMDGPALDRAAEAFTDALVDFSPRHRRAALKAMVAQVREMQPETDQRIDSAVRGLVVRELRSTLATSAAGSSDSTPAPPG